MRIAILCLAVLFTGCQDTAKLPANAPAETLTVRTETVHFKIVAGDISPAVWADVITRLEANYVRVVQDLHVTSLGQITVRIWSNDTAFRDELERTLGKRYAAHGYVTPSGDICVLAGPAVALNAVHEFGHIVTMAVRADAPNNPRWLWESVALFENGELVEPRSWPFFPNGPFPTLAQLNGDFDVNTAIYQVGYTIAEFVVHRFGRNALLQLIRTRGNIRAVLGITVTEFESQWVAYVKAR